MATWLLRAVIRPLRTAIWFSLLLPLCTGSAAGQQRERQDFFESRIRPVLVAQCYECHSASAARIQGGLRLDWREGMRRGGDSGPAVVPGNVDESLILSALRHDAFQMPPGKRLSERIVADFERWIRTGAADPRTQPASAKADDEIRLAARHHWAFRPVEAVQPPRVNQPGRIESPIDSFVLEKLEQAGLQFAPPADRATLARRVFLDLTGLPPTPDQLQPFLSDPSPDAFPRLVDRLLASPQYGERWGRYWLDVARYADNKGYVFFEEQNYPWAWTYRDYVVSAFNADLPYDRFVLEQLAADLLPEETSGRNADGRSRLAALGFLTVGARFMNNTHDILDDRIDVVTRGLLGLTVTCARCHDHKYDPVSQADYYALYGVFRSCVEPILPPQLRAAEDTAEHRKFQQGMAERLQRLEEFIEAQRLLIMQGARKRAGEYLLAVWNKRHHPDTENFMLLTDKGALNPAMIHRWEVYLNRARLRKDPIWTLWHAYADLPRAEFAESAIEVHRGWIEAEAPLPIHPLVRDAFATGPPESSGPPGSMEEVATRYGKLLGEVDRQWQQATTAGEGPGSVSRLDSDDAESLRQVLYGPQSPPMIPRELSWGFLDLLPDRPTQGEFKKLLKEVETWSSQQPGAPPRAMALFDAEVPHEPVIFLRGNPNRQGPPVARRFPEFFASASGEFRQGSGRLELARRIIDPAQPLTARVLVNRIWMQHFGRPLVDTPSDFGLRSEPPTHPELLDWLATRVRDQGWSIKRLHRTILLSSTYQQASLTTPDLWQRAAGVDPENRLLWTFPRKRLEFEAIRDSLLAVTGQLDRRLGGPPVQALTGFRPRRTLYGFVDRMNLPGLMRTFDYPDPAATSPQREQTTVAPQALFFLNHDFVYQCAERVSRRPDVKAIEDTDQRVRRIYGLLLGRLPDARELDLARRYLEADTRRLTDSAWQYGYAAVDDSHQVSGFTRLEYWTGSRWQAGPQLPDPKLGWVFIDRTGGHPAATLQRCAVRRWTAPRDGIVDVQGTLKHDPQPGNGVRARLVSSSRGLLGQWTAHHEQVATSAQAVPVQAGDTLDFVVDFRGEILHDEHHWPVTIRYQSADSLAPGESRPHKDTSSGKDRSTDGHDPPARDWDSQRDFTGAASTPWVNYVHALLMSNEFLFVD